VVAHDEHTKSAVYNDAHHARAGGGYSVLIELDYGVAPRPRWGHGLPAHPQLYALIDANRDRYAGRLEQFLGYRDGLARVAPEADASAPDRPFWNNPWFTGLDAVALYGFIRAERPRLYLEIGSGTSTKFARLAATDGQLATRIVSIDPQPRAEIDRLCDRVIRSPLEDAPPTVFEMLQPGDVLFMDGSHRVFTNSDTVVFFLEVLPKLPAGVFVHVHDIFLPYDYPPDWNGRFYSEQYLLAAMFLSGARSVQVELPSAFVGHDAALRSMIEPAWAGYLDGRVHIGGSFWMKTLEWDSPFRLLNGAA
jgi:hypothetical protein